MMTEETVEAFKYEFSKPGALTPIFNYHRNMLKLMELGKLQPIEVPTLIIWVSIFSIHVLTVASMSLCEILTRRQDHFFQCVFIIECFREKTLQDFLQKFVRIIVCDC